MSFFLISFAALGDTWKKIRKDYSGTFDNTNSPFSDLIKNDDQNLVKVISMIYHFLKYDIDKRNFFKAAIPISKSMLNNRYFYSGFFDKKLLSWRALSG